MQEHHRITKKILKDYKNFCCEMFGLKNVTLDIRFNTPRCVTYSAFTEKKGGNRYVRKIILFIGDKENWIQPVFDVFAACRKFYLDECMEETARRRFVGRLKEQPVNETDIYLESFQHIRDICVISAAETSRRISAESAVFAELLIEQMYCIRIECRDSGIDPEERKLQEEYLQQRFFKNTGFVGKTSELAVKYGLEQYRKQIDNSLSFMS